MGNACMSCRKNSEKGDYKISATTTSVQSSAANLRVVEPFNSRPTTSGPNLGPRVIAVKGAVRVVGSKKPVSRSQPKKSVSRSKSRKSVSRAGIAFSRCKSHSTPRATTRRSRAGRVNARKRFSVPNSRESRPADSWYTSTKERVECGKPGCSFQLWRGAPAKSWDKHNKDHRTHGVYHCQFCGVYRSDSSAIRRHLVVNHPNVGPLESRVQACYQ